MVLPSLQNAHRRRFTSRKHTSPAHINHHTLVLFSLPGSQKKRVKSATGERETTSRETNFRLKLTLSAGEIQCEPKLTSVEIFSFPFFRLQEREMGGGASERALFIQWRIRAAVAWMALPARRAFPVRSPAGSLSGVGPHPSIGKPRERERISPVFVGPKGPRDVRPRDAESGSLARLIKISILIVRDYILCVVRPAVSRWRRFRCRLRLSSFHLFILYSTFVWCFWALFYGSCIS